MKTIFDVKYRKLCKKERSSYQKFRGVIGIDSISQRTRDQEYANYLNAKSSRINYRAKNKKVVRKKSLESKMVLN